MNLSSLEPLPETPRDLERYLEQIPALHVTGTRESGDCILSRFLTWTYRTKVYVTDHLVIIDSVEYALSPWMIELLAGIRAHKGKITTAVALALLAPESERRAA